MVVVAGSCDDNTRAVLERFIRLDSARSEQVIALAVVGPNNEVKEPPFYNDLSADFLNQWFNMINCQNMAPEQVYANVIVGGLYRGQEPAVSTEPAMMIVLRSAGATIVADLYEFTRSGASGSSTTNVDVTTDAGAQNIINAACGGT